MDAFDAIGEMVVWIIKWSFTALTIYYALRLFIRIIRKRKPHVKAYKVGSYNDYHVQKGDYEKNTRSSSFFEADYVKGEDTVIDDYHSLYQYEIEGTIYKTDIHDKVEFGWGPAKKELILYYNRKKPEAALPARLGFVLRHLIIDGTIALTCWGFLTPFWKTIGTWLITNFY